VEGEGVVDGGGGGGGGGCGGGSGSGGPSERMSHFYVEMRDEFELAIGRAVGRRRDGQEFDIGNWVSDIDWKYLSWRVPCRVYS
jgi:hypothetical protein